MSHKQLTLHPAAGPSFIHGWPGLPPDAARGEACVLGRVAVRLGSGLRASWLRIELRKLESVPGMQPWGELIGSGPLTLWRAADAAPRHSAHQPDGGLLADRHPEVEWHVLTNRDFSFRLPIPPALPPSARIDKAAGVGYQLVASLFVRARRGMFRKKEASVGSIIQTVQPLVLLKHELLPAWPTFSRREQHSIIAETDQGRIRVALHHDRLAFGPGDAITAQLVLDSEAQGAVKLKNLVFSLRETVSFKLPQRAQKRRASLDLTARRSSAAARRVTTIASCFVDSGKKLQPSETRTYDIALSIPQTHTLVTITTAKHIEVAYTLRLSLQANKGNIVLDHMPVTMSHCSTSEAEALLPQIGYVEGLSSGPAQVQNSSVLPSPRRAASLNESLVSGIARNEGSITMSAIGRAPLRRNNSMTSVSTGLSSALNRPNVAGRGVPGAWQSHAGGDAFTRWGGGRFSLPLSALPPAEGCRFTLPPNSLPVPVRATMVAEAMTQGLNGAERLALTSRIDRRPVEGIPLSYIKSDCPVVQVRSPPEEITEDKRQASNGTEANAQAEDVLGIASDPLGQLKHKMESTQQDQIPKEARTHELALPECQVPFPEKGAAKAITPGLMMPPSLTSREVSQPLAYLDVSAAPVLQRWSREVDSQSPSFGWGAPLDRTSTLPLSLQIPRLTEAQEAEVMRAASITTVSPSPKEGQEDPFGLCKTASVPAYDGVPSPQEKLGVQLRLADRAEVRSRVIFPSASNPEFSEQAPLDKSSITASDGIKQKSSTGLEPSDHAGSRTATVASQTVPDRPPSLRPGMAIEKDLERHWHQAQAGNQAPKSTVRPLPALPVRPLPSRGSSTRFSYDVHAAGAYGARGALIVDRTAPEKEYDPLIASSPWGSIRSPDGTAGATFSRPSTPTHPGHTPPIPPKVSLT